MIVDLSEIKKNIAFKKINKNIKNQILNINEDTDYLSSGVEGDVYDLGFNKVIKFSNFNNEVFSSDIKIILKTLKFIKENKQRNLPKVYDFGKIDKNIYFYICEKLFPISNKEQRIIGKLYEIYEDQNKINLKTKNEKIINDYINIFKNKNFLVNDLHESNIMKDKRGSYKLCDLGCVRLNPLLKKIK